MLLFFGRYGKRSGHVDGSSSAGQLNVQGQIHHCKNRGFSCLWLLITGVSRERNTLWILFDLL